MGRIQRERVAVAGDRIAALRIAPPRAVTPRGTVFVPPLIGGSGLQQVAYFRGLNRAGWTLATFDYRGHGTSSGNFCVRHALEDARAALAHVRARTQGTLVGMGDCFGAIPLLVAAERVPGALDAVTLFNPMPDLRTIATPRELWNNAWAAPPGLRPRHPFDLRGLLFATNARLFPGVDKSRDHFGILRYERARTWRLAFEYALLRPLAKLRLPGLNALVVYGRGDRLLRLDDARSESAYREAFARVLPQARFHPLVDVDHFWTASYDVANRLAEGFFASLGDQPALRRDESTLAPRRPPASPEPPTGVRLAPGAANFSANPVRRPAETTT